MTEEERQLSATAEALGPTTRGCLGTVLSGFEALRAEHDQWLRSKQIGERLPLAVVARGDEAMTRERVIHLKCPSCERKDKRQGFRIRAQSCICGWAREERSLKGEA